MADPGPKVHFMRLPISLPCPVPVVPGTPDTCRGDEPIPLEQRTERCCVDAFWMIGGQITCDIHLREACRFLGIDYDDLLAEAGGPASTEDKPWHERHRYAQPDAAVMPPAGGAL
jgi:hypothetical protein